MLFVLDSVVPLRISYSGIKIQLRKEGHLGFAVQVVVSHALNLNTTKADVFLVETCSCLSISLWSDLCWSVFVFLDGFAGLGYG